MQYGTKPQNFIEWIASKAGVIPVPVIDSILPLIQTRALLVANRCGVFKQLAITRECETDVLAKKLSLDSECLGLLLRLLQSMQYVRNDNGRWSLSKMGERHFGQNATEPYHSYVEYGFAQWKFIENMEQVLRSGRGIDFHDHQSEEEWEYYQKGMLENARNFAWFVSKYTPVPKGAKSCLDIAGSHGYLGGVLCEANPPMRSVVIDRPEALSTSQSLGRSESWYPLVRFQEGNLLKDDFGRDHDVVLLSNILHHFTEQVNLEILKKVYQSLKAGGVVSIFEIETPDKDKTVDAAADAFALYFRITSTSACFTSKDYLSWLSQAGFKNSRVIRSIRMPSRMLIIADK